MDQSHGEQDTGTSVLPDEVEGLLLEEAQERGPVFVEAEALTFTVRIPRLLIVSGLHRGQTIITITITIIIIIIIIIIIPLQLS